jgi:uncharacterized protein
MSSVPIRFAVLLALIAATVTPAAARTERTGDRIDGIEVIDRLDVSDLRQGRIHRFWFRASGNSVGQGWYVPVVVIRGARPGRRLLLTAGIHGDELNGIDVIHRMANSIDPDTLSGTLVMIPGLNTPGLLHSTRMFTPSGGTDGDNLNRAMPGSETSTDVSSVYAARLWNRLMTPNADQAVDLHTQSRGTAYVFYVFAETEAAMAIARAVAPDVIRLDPGIRGAVENELNRVNIPAITLELERPEQFDDRVITRAIDGIRRVMVNMGMLTIGSAPAPTVTPFVANNGVGIRTTQGGWVRLLVAANQDVTAGQEVALVSDPFGRVVERLKAPRAGRVSSITTDPRAEPGGGVLRIVFDDPDPRCARGCE